MSTSVSPLDDTLDDLDVDTILNSLGLILRWGFDSDKLRNPPKIMKYINCSSKIMLKKLDARAEHVINRPSQSRFLPFIEQRTAFEGILAMFKVFRGHAPRRLALLQDHYYHEQACFKTAQAASELFPPVFTFPIASKPYQPASEQQHRMVSERYRAALEQYRAALEQYQAASVEQYKIATWRCRGSSEWYQADAWEHTVTSKHRRQATERWRYRAAAQFVYQAAEQRYQAASERYQAALAQYKVAAEQVSSILEGVFEYLRLTFEEIHGAFEVLQADFEQLPRVRLNPPPIFLRVVGPISMDLRPFHRGKILDGKNVYSLGSMFLENLICDAWTPWDLRSYMALVAAKIVRKGCLYPAAFTSKLSLLVKGLAESNLQLTFQFGAKELEILSLKLPVESAGREVSTALTSRAGNDALIRRAVESTMMQRSLSAMINLGIRNLTSRVKLIGERAECFGGSAEIWKAQLTFSNAKMTVAVKYLRLCVTEVTKHLHREIRIWQSLEHSHVLPLLGVCHNDTGYESIRASSEHIVDPMVSIGIVYPWMVNGTLVDYLKHHQTKAENIEELRLRLLIQVCSGLMYLHSKNIVHGDLHGGNVLVDSDGCACLADFGLSAVVAECRGTSRTNPGGISSPHGGALRWAAPELVVVQEGADPRLHPSADIYSSGGLILQAYTGDMPYWYYNERRVLGAIITGEKPRRPTSEEVNISDTLWSVIEECWRDDPLERPTAAALMSRLQAIYSGLQI